MVECEMTCHAQSFVNHQWAFAQAFSNCKKMKEEKTSIILKVRKKKIETTVKNKEDLL